MGGFERFRPALKVTLLYLVFGLLWILLSDGLLGVLAESPAEFERWQTYKGSAFVVLSAAVIFFLVKREARLRERTRELYWGVLDLVPDPVVVQRAEDGTCVEVNSSFATVLGRSPEDVVGLTPEELGLRFEPAGWADYVRRLEQEGLVEDLALDVTLPDGSERTFQVSSRRHRLDGEEFVFTATSDVTTLETARERLESQVRRIRALRDIDVAITSSLDVRVTLNVVLDQVTEQLGVDAASVLLLDETTRTLEHAASRGVGGSAPRQARLEVGEGLAGRAVRDEELVWAADLRRDGDRFARTGFLDEEGFVSYAAAPLATKGRVRGVLEVFHRTRLEPSRDWFEFLETLAGQTSIALDSANMYRDLQRSHEELREAYDKTIEGWARALDLRDRETHGHTRRVTEVTLRLARRLGVAREDLIHIRRGALLHDIGKMGVPDSILLKPGPLDDDEWAVMKKHPELAFRLLSPIEFLRPALDIPRYHHEKWDGSGYPEGLRGEEIPLPARIFAVVDVWDALLSNRPYRDAWDEEDVYEHLREERGSHFDPEVVDAFLELDLEDIPFPERADREDVADLQTEMFGT